VKDDDRPDRPRTALPIATLKKWEMWFKRPKVECRSSNWGS